MLDELKDKITIKGCLNVLIYRDGVITDAWEDENMILTSARSALAALVAGAGAGKVVSRIGFGINGAEPAPDDAEIQDACIKSLEAVTYPSPSQVRFAWSLGGSEANGKAIAEFALICADGKLFSRKARGAIRKESDISLSGAWTITF